MAKGPVRIIIERTNDGDYTVEAEPLYLDEQPGGMWLFSDAGTAVVFVRGYLAIDEDDEAAAWAYIRAREDARCGARKGAKG